MVIGEARHSGGLESAHRIPGWRAPCNWASEMSTQFRDPAISEVRREAALLKTGALQNAILNSANFSSIATDEKGVIQLFNVGAERMLGYEAGEVVDRITPAGISDPQGGIGGARPL